MKHTLKTQYIFIGLFFLGLIVGTFVVNLLFRGTVELNQLWNVDMLDLNGIDVLMKKEYFVYILMKRLKQFLILFILMEFIKKEFVMSGLSLGFGFTVSALISLETMRLGIQGVVLSFVYFFPHYIVYIGIIALFIFQIREETKKPMWMRLLIMIGFVLIGCFLESFINPYLLGIMFNFMRV